MTDYMKEAERLLEQYENAYVAVIDMSVDQARSSLLAHIQRGAVPEGYVAVPRFLAENHRNLTDVPRYQRILDDCLAAAPDHFRDAAEIVADTEDNGFDLLHDRPHTEMPGCRGAKSLKVRTSAEVPDKWEYYYKDNDCPAADSGDPNCICWYDEGRGPYNNARHDDEDTFLEWRRVKAPAPAEVSMPEPVAYLYTLEYGSTVVNTKLSVHHLNYPFGVCGSDYLARSDDGMSYVRQTPLYTAAALRVEVKP